MNHEIAGYAAWGPDEIRSRGEHLASMIVSTWPGPIANRSAQVEENPLWELLKRIMLLLPGGHWTTYGDLARLLGTAAQPLGQKLATMNPAPNAHRVLNSVGEVAANFAWNEQGMDQPRIILEAEGVAFSDAGRADPDLRLSAERLEDLRRIAEDDFGPND